MANIIRWDPFRDMMSLQRAVDRAFDEALMGQRSGWEGNNRWELPVDVVEKNDEYILKASIPGAKPDDINITYNNGMLTIQTETQSEEEHQEDRYLIRERRSGSYTRSVSLPNAIDANKIDASFDAGILTLHIPKTEEMKPKRIPIQSGSKVIESKSHGHNGNS